MSRVVRVDGITPEAKSHRVVVVFPAGTVIHRGWEYVGERRTENRCCSELYPCDTRAADHVEETLTVAVSVEVEVSEEALRDVAWRALVAKGGKGTAGGMRSRRLGARPTQARVLETKPHERKLPTRDELVDQAKARGLNLSDRSRMERLHGQADRALCPMCASVTPELDLFGFSEVACYNCQAPATGKVSA